MSSPKQIDVARRAGVSRTTVSRVLNNYTENFSVRSEVRERIWEAAKELNYRPDALAQMLRREKKTGLVGWFGAMYPVVFSATVLDALAERLSQEGLLVSPSYVGPRHEAIRLPWMRLDAAVLSGIRTSEEAAELEDVGLPYVCVNCVGGPHGSSVEFEDAEGMRLACEHLLALGHRRIAYGVPPKEIMGAHSSVSARECAYRKMMAGEGLEARIVEIPQDDRCDERLLREVRERGVTAVVTYSGHTAILAMSALQRAGVRIPEEVSLVAFNDEYPLPYLEPSVTVVSLSGAEAGHAAADLVLAHLAEPMLAPQRTILPEVLLVRGSTGPVAGGPRR